MSGLRNYLAGVEFRFYDEGVSGLFEVAEWREVIDFSRVDLVRKFGSWVRVQVAFYDYIFKCGTEMEASDFNDQRFADGANAYEQAIGQIEKKFTAYEMAWDAFVKEEKCPHGEAEK